MTGKNPNPFGKVLSYDPALIAQAHLLQGLMIRHREPTAIYLGNHAGRMIQITDVSWRAGPARILVEKIPDRSIDLPPDGWVFHERSLRFPGFSKLPLKRLKPNENLELSGVKDYPGHMHIAISRAIRTENPDIAPPLENLAQALNVRLTEALEPNLLELVGMGEGEFPSGDVALCGLILTARALIFGRRLRLNWFPRFSIEVRRFVHRTTFFGQNLLHFALEGRPTEFQARFFNAMARDFEGANDLVVSELSELDPWSGKPFLHGVRTLLDLIKPELYGLMTRNSVRKP